MVKRHRDDDSEFFGEMTDQSEVKVTIVSKFFSAWASVMRGHLSKSPLRSQDIGYVDLFAGPGRYNDGTPSTPILILKRAVEEPNIGQHLRSHFNDFLHSEALRAEIDGVPGVDSLVYRPIITNECIDDSYAKRLPDWGCPTFFFIDPFGYNGLSLELVQTALAGWGSDCLFFFNYNRVNLALSNSTFTHNMNVFFGPSRADQMRQELEGKTPVQRQQIIIKRLKEALKEMRGEFSLEYYFMDENGARLSHFLIFACKNRKGYDIMKNIMASESSSLDHGVPSFGFDPRDKVESPQGMLFEPPSPIDGLAEELVQHFAGRTLGFKELFHEHNVGKAYVDKNYREALDKLEASGRIKTNEPASERMRNGKPLWGKNVQITFTVKGG